MGSNGENKQPVPSAGQEKTMQTFRMPSDLVVFLKGEAARGRRDLTGHVVRLLEGYRTYFGLPAAAAALLEADRQAAGLERFEYLLHVLYERSHELRAKEPGFDGPRAAVVDRP